MKTISWAEIGGKNCDNVESAETEDAILNKWLVHYREVHPEALANATDDDKKDWMVMHRQVWEEATES
jgi:hypothetical protein